MQSFIDEMFTEIKKKSSFYNEDLDISELRFSFSFDFTSKYYFLSRLAFTRFQGLEKDFSKMSWIEKMRCPEIEMVNFEEARLESEPQYMRIEIGRLTTFRNMITKDYNYTKALAQKELDSGFVESGLSCEFTKRGNSIHSLYQRLFHFFTCSYREVERTLRILEDFPAWDQDLVRDYRNVIEYNIYVLNKIITLEEIMCDTKQERTKGSR